jgi:hypothetical protein
MTVGSMIPDQEAGIQGMSGLAPITTGNMQTLTA